MAWGKELGKKLSAASETKEKYNFGPKILLSIFGTT